MTKRYTLPLSFIERLTHYKKGMDHQTGYGMPGKRVFQTATFSLYASLPVSSLLCKLVDTPPQRLLNTQYTNFNLLFLSKRGYPS